MSVCSSYCDRSVKELRSDENCRGVRQREQSWCVRIVTVLQAYGAMVKCASQWRNYVMRWG